VLVTAEGEVLTASQRIAEGTEPNPVPAAPAA
jgi:hypothetical protein